MKRVRNRQLRASRVLLCVCGIVLLAIAAIGLLLAAGALDKLGDALDSRTALLNGEGRDWLQDHRRTLQIIGVIAGVLLIAIGLGWLKNQIPPLRHQDDEQLTNRDDHHIGVNVVRGGAMARALEQDLERSPLVRRARATLQPAHQRLHVRLDVVDTANVEEVQALVRPAIDRLVTVAEFETLPRVQTDLRLVDDEESRVA